MRGNGLWPGRWTPSTGMPYADDPILRHEGQIAALHERVSDLEDGGANQAEVLAALRESFLAHINRTVMQIIWQRRFELLPLIIAVVALLSAQPEFVARIWLFLMEATPG